jgi:hypothetical protein
MHSYRRPKNPDRKKRQRPGAQTVAPIEEDEVGYIGDDSESPQFPDVLPTEFKLGRNFMKACVGIMSHNDGDLMSTNATEFFWTIQSRPENPRKGQLRWGDFERVTVSNCIWLVALFTQTTWIVFRR